jgi:3-carboxy-cis,cis-muconate cycloisomerase
MTVSPFDSRMLGPLFGDPELSRCLSDTEAVAAMIAVERALARAQGALGIIPTAAAAAIDAGLAQAVVAPETLADGAARSGVPVPSLVQALAATLPPEDARWLHWGATSQDIVDSALALRLDAALAHLLGRLEALLGHLDAGADRWADLPMAGRTRSQVAAPIAFGTRCAAWAAPLAELRVEAATLRPRIGRVQLGGSVGTNAVLAPHGQALADRLAAELGLMPAAPWHSNRVALASLGGWCASVAAAVGKMAGDLVLMGRSESFEARAGTGGGSSTMPQKANPVAAETILALARYAAPLASTLHLATIHAEERDGSAWALEWLALPQLLLCAGGALRLGADLAGSLAPDPAAMGAVLARDGGAVMAEAATFLLARERPRPEAEALVRQALAAARADGTTLAEALVRLAPGRDWARLLDAAALVARSRQDRKPTGSS